MVFVVSRLFKHLSHFSTVNLLVSQVVRPIYVVNSEVGGSALAILISNLYSVGHSQVGLLTIILI